MDLSTTLSKYQGLLIQGLTVIGLCLVIVEKYLDVQKKAGSLYEHIKAPLIWLLLLIGILSALVSALTSVIIPYLIHPPAYYN